MNHPAEYYTSKPNLLRVAREVAAMEHPERTVNALGAMLSARAGKEPSASQPLPEGEDNNQKFNTLLNSCQNPRAIYNSLAALPPGMQAPCEPRINILKAVMNHRHSRNTQ